MLKQIFISSKYFLVRSGLPKFIFKVLQRVKFCLNIHGLHEYMIGVKEKSNLGNERKTMIMKNNLESRNSLLSLACLIHPNALLLVGVSSFGG